MSRLLRRFSQWLGVLPPPRQGLLLGLLCALCVLGVRAINRLHGLEDAALDTSFQLRGIRYPAPQVVILVADNATVTRFGGWPLPRRVYADVVRLLHKAKPKTIAFDVVFPTRPGGTRDDADLVAACREAGNVVHAAVLNADTPHSALRVSNHAAPDQFSALTSRFVLNDGGISCRQAGSGIVARPALIQDADGMGHVTVFPERDGTLRRIPHAIRYQGTGVYPSLALAAAAHFLRVPAPEIMATPNGSGSTIKLAGRSLPVDSNGETLVNWVGPNGAIPMYTFNQLFNGQLPDEFFKDRLVLIGITAAGAYEHRATPFSPNQPVVELQANAIDNILSNRPLHQAPNWLPLALLFAWPGLIGFLIGGRNATISALATVMLGGLLALGALALFSYADFYLPLAGPLLASVLTCGVCIGQRQIYEAQQLRRAEARYARAVRGANDGIWDWDLQSQQVYYSPRWKEMLGYGDEEIGNSPDEWLARIHPEDKAQVEHELKLHLDGHSPQFQSEYRIEHKDGTYRWMLGRGIQVQDEEAITLSDPAPRAEQNGVGQNGTHPAVRIAGSQTDITTRKEAEERLRKNAFYDSLTDLPNRALFINRLEQAIGRAKRNPQYLFAVLFLDLDRFKNVNDSLGHTQGDKLLIEVARRLTGCLRLGDTPARLGGDEFTLLLDDIADVNDATRVAERFQEELAKAYDLDGTEVFTQVSIGIALSSTGYNYPEDVLRDADTAMYRAKALGTGQHQIFDEAMHARAVALLRLETDLRRAIERQNFQVYYQPIVSLTTGHIIGFEALARWNHPTRGIVPPGEFIAIAEDTGIIVSIDQWVLREACRQTQAWQVRFQDRNPLTISVNLSSKQFSQSDLVNQIERVVKSTEFDPHQLKLEITESVIMENAESATAMLVQMKELGIQLSIDDFGTGYSSLSYLHRFPLDFLKIDRSFVNRIGSDGENTEIVRAIISLSNNLGMRVIAEGVETPAQLAQLRALGCDYGQGYLFSKPITGDAATALLAENPQW